MRDVGTMVIDKRYGVIEFLPKSLQTIPSKRKELIKSVVLKNIKLVKPEIPESSFCRINLKHNSIHSKFKLNSRQKNQINCLKIIKLNKKILDNDSKSLKQFNLNLNYKLDHNSLSNLNYKPLPIKKKEDFRSIQNQKQLQKRKHFLFNHQCSLPGMKIDSENIDQQEKMKRNLIAKNSLPENNFYFPICELDQKNENSKESFLHKCIDIAKKFSFDNNYILSKEYLTDNSHLPSSREIRIRLRKNPTQEE